MASRPVPAVTAASDCERCRSGWVTQPANTVSSLAYVVAGADLWRRRDADRVVAASVVAVGLGSVAYHGPGGAWGRWAHDASLLALLGVVALDDLAATTGRARRPGEVALVVAAALAAAHPATSEPAQLGAGAVAVAAELRRRALQAGAGRAGLPAGALSAGLVLQVLGRSGRPWCRPDAFAQPHAGWHVLSALALWARHRRPQEVAPAGSVSSSGW